MVRACACIAISSQQQTDAKNSELLASFSFPFVSSRREILPKAQVFWVCRASVKPAAVTILCGLS
jgi:hypothetical protein